MCALDPATGNIRGWSLTPTRGRGKIGVMERGHSRCQKIHFSSVFQLYEVAIIKKRDAAVRGCKVTNRAQADAKRAERRAR